MQSQCVAGEYECRDGDCIAGDKQNDGYNDCTDGTDEGTIMDLFARLYCLTFSLAAQLIIPLIPSMGSF